MPSKPRLFIGSSQEGIPLARAINDNLDRDAIVTVWDKVFAANYSNLDNLLTQAADSDFAVFVWSPDDTSHSRGRSAASVRDNLVFEFGLFLGELGRDRVFVVTPSQRQDLRILSDLNGIALLQYDSDRAEGDHAAKVGATAVACHAVRESMRKHGTRERPPEQTLEGILDQLRVMMERSTTTKFVGKFPHFFEAEVLSCLRKAESTIRIACDFIAYGSFSAYDTSQQYLSILEAKRTSGTNVQVILLNAALRQAQLEAQFAQNETAWAVLCDDPDFMRLLVAYATRRRRSIATRDEFIEVQQQHDAEDGQNYRHSIATEIRERSERMPVFLWIADSREAIFSIPTYDAGVSEYGFYTRDLDLVAALIRIWEAYKNGSKVGPGANTS